jgi:hypothetical protein
MAFHDDLHAATDDQGGDGEIMPAQAEGGQPDHRRRGHGDDHADQHPEPGRDLVGDEQERRAVGSDAEEHRVAQGYLPAIAGHDVPGLCHHPIEEDHDHDMLGEGGVEDEGISHQHRRGRHTKGFLAPGHGGVEGLGQGGPECVALVVGAASRHGHQNLPNRPCGRKKTTTR